MDMLGDLAMEGDEEFPELSEDTGDVLEPMPDFFVGMRPILLCADGSPRLWVRKSWWIFLIGAGIFPSCVFAMGIKAEGGRHDTQMAMIRFAFMGIPFCAGTVYTSFLADVIRPETGRLARLGVGVKLVADHKIRALRRWRLVMMAPAVGIFLFGSLFIKFYVEVTMAAIESAPCTCEKLVCQTDALAAGDSRADHSGDDCDICCFANERYPRQLDVYFLPPAPACLISLLVGYPCAMAWYFSMKVAVVLSLDEVTGVMKTTTKAALLDDETWSTNVAQPTIRLATDTMQDLSRGWGTGTGFTTLLFAIITILNFIGTVHDIRIGEDSGDILRRGTGTIGGAMAPFFLAIDAAHVSSRCDHLLKAINSLRLEWSSTEEAMAVHGRVYPLQVTLNELNHGQGLGFTIFTKVVDKKTLNVLAISIASFFGTVIPLIMAFMPDAPLPVGSEAAAVCIGPADAARAAAMLSQVAVSGIEDDASVCLSLNATLEEVLGGDGH